MKKLSKLKLKQFHEMSECEMKNIIGGYADYHHYQCKVGATCSATFISEYEEIHTLSGICVHQVSGCFCDVGTGTQYTNHSQC